MYLKPLQSTAPTTHQIVLRTQRLLVFASLARSCGADRHDCAACIFVVFEQSKVVQHFNLKGCTTLDCSNATKMHVRALQLAQPSVHGQIGP